MGERSKAFEGAAAGAGKAKTNARSKTGWKTRSEAGAFADGLEDRHATGLKNGLADGRRALTAAFVSPALAMIGVFVCIPACAALVLSFSNMGPDLRITDWSMDNYVRLLTGDPRLPVIIAQTAIYAVAATALFGVGLALAIALAAHAAPPRAAAVIRALWLAPQVMPGVVYAMLWGWAADPGGPLSAASHGLGLGPDPRLGAPLAFVTLATGVASVSFGMVVFTAALRSLPADLVHAARLDGARGGDILADIVLPHLRPAIIVVAASQALSLLGSFQLILLLTGGGPNFESTVYAQYIYRRAFEDGLYGYGAALSSLLLIAGAIVIALAWGRLRRAGFLAADPLDPEG